jgi:hypothetical protein
MNAEIKDTIHDRTAEEWFDKNSMNYKGIQNRHHAINMISDFAQYAKEIDFGTFWTIEQERTPDLCCGIYEELEEQVDIINACLGCGEEIAGGDVYCSKCIINK